MEGIEEQETFENLVMDFSVDLLVFLATLTNIGVISCVIFRVTKFDSGFLLLLQLAGNYSNYLPIINSNYLAK